MAFSVPGYYGQLSPCKKSEKTNDPILKKVTEERMDGWTDGQTDNNDFIGRCSTDIEDPTVSKYIF